MNRQCSECGAVTQLGTICMDCFNKAAAKWWRSEVGPEMERRRQAMIRHPLLKLLNGKAQ